VGGEAEGERERCRGGKREKERWSRERERERDFGKKNHLSISLLVTWDEDRMPPIVLVN
jgi:hypothetical protein